MVFDAFPLRGYSLPLTPQGHSSLVEPPPWHFGGEIMQLAFRISKTKAKELIPPPLELTEEPGKGIVWFVEWISVSESNPDMVFINPERTMYQECLVMIQCSLNGEQGYFVPYIWVDNDFTLMRGFVQGFPKKLCQIYKTKLHELNPKIGGKRPGAKIKGICQAHGERIIEGSLMLTRKANQSELPLVRLYLMRYFPSIEDVSNPAVHELVISEISNVRITDIWAGDTDLEFFVSDVEEVANLAPIEMLGGFSYSMGFTISGGKVVHQYL